MNPRLLSLLVLLTLILQGMTAASAGATELGDMSQHCSDHQAAGGDCPCCSELDMLAGGCATSCAVAVALPAAALFVPAPSHDALVVHADDSFLSAVHPPLDRPPIA